MVFTTAPGGGRARRLRDRSGPAWRATLVAGPIWQRCCGSLAMRGITRLLVEGGATVNASFLDRCLADRLEIFRAPTIAWRGGTWRNRRAGSLDAWGKRRVFGRPAAAVSVSDLLESFAARGIEENHVHRIVSDIGQVRSIEKRGDTHLVIATHYDVSAMDIGVSVACAGVCLTVVDKGTATDRWFAVTASGETLSKTTIGDMEGGRSGQSGTAAARRRRIRRPYRHRPCRWCRRSRERDAGGRVRAL